MGKPRTKRIAVIGFIIVILAYTVFGERLRSLSLVVYASLPILVGSLALLSLVTEMSSLDELQRRIQVEGLATAFGAMFLIYWIEIAFADYGEALNFSPELHIVFLAGSVSLGTLIARWRYR